MHRCYGYFVKLETIIKVGRRLKVEDDMMCLSHIKSVLNYYNYNLDFVMVKEHRSGFIMILYEGDKTKEEITDDDLRVDPSRLVNVIKRLEIDENSLGFYTVDED